MVELAWLQVGYVWLSRLALMHFVSCTTTTQRQKTQRLEPWCVVACAAGAVRHVQKGLYLLYGRRPTRVHTVVVLLVGITAAAAEPLEDPS